MIICQVTKHIDAFFARQDTIPIELKEIAFPVLVFRIALPVDNSKKLHKIIGFGLSNHF